MTAEKERSITDFIKLVSPGTLIRDVIDDLIRSGLGALIAFDSKELQTQNILDGGFRINSRLTSRKLFELGKMDGAIILSPDLKRILYANTMLAPDVTINTTETGTRHKAAERTAKQANTLVIAVSERRKKTTLYYQNSKYTLKSSEVLTRNISSNIHLLEKQRELFNESTEKINILELSELVSVSDICKILQRAEMIQRITESVKRDFTELGREGNIMHMRYRELIKGVEKTKNNLLRDYSVISLKKSKNLLSNITFEGLLNLESIARLLFEKPLEESILPKGYRFLSHLSLSEKEISQITKNFKNIKEIIDAESKNFEPILKNRSSQIKKEIENLREQILNGKVVC